jgi:signal transduction histidine kinase
MVTILLLRMRQQSTRAFRLLVHAADVVWPAVISAFAAGQNNPFFLFFVFVIAAAAYRWWLWETLGTAVAAVSLLWAESLLFHLGFVAWANARLLQINLPPLAINLNDFEPRALFMRSIYLVVLGLLLGYLADQQKQLRSEKAVIARVLGHARVDAGLTGTIQEILGELVTMYGARQGLLASQELNSQHIFVGEIRVLNNIPTALHWLEASPQDRKPYLCETPGDACFVQKNGRQPLCLSLDREGRKLREPPLEFVQGLSAKHDFQSMITVSFAFPREWTGRIFLLDPAEAVDTEDELRFLQELVRQVGPAVYNVYLLRRLRLRAGAVERARFARELHDGAIQSLIAMEMQVDVLRRQAINNSPSVPAELQRIQGLMREEVLKLRELMQQMKTLDVDARKILSVLSDTVERFQRETGIAARFVSEIDPQRMPQNVCRELARIVQEALVNIRKHSGAKHAFVRLSGMDGIWTLVVEDDGAGFPFSGRLSQADLEKQGKAPAVIKERVQLIAGELTIESNPGRGSRLEVSVPYTQDMTYG